MSAPQKEAPSCEPGAEEQGEQRHQGGEVNRARGTPKDEAPYVWLAATALRQIREHVGHVKGASAIAVYVGLASIANDTNAETGKPNGPSFTATIGRIAAVSTLGYSATAEALRGLESAGVVFIQRNERPREAAKEKLPSTYTLLTLHRESTKGVKRESTKGFVERRAVASNEFSKNPHKGDSKEEEREAAPSSAAPLAPGGQRAAPGAESIVNKF